MALPRVLGVLAAMTGLLLACSTTTEKPEASPASGHSNTSLGSPLPAAPATPACGDVLASMSVRDKLAQLLMVGVTGADDARAVVENQHVGGIMIGSWTDLSMMGATARRHRRLGEPAAARGQRRRGGRSGFAPGEALSAASRRRGCWPRP